MRRTLVAVAVALSSRGTALMAQTMPSGLPSMGTAASVSFGGGGAAAHDATRLVDVPSASLDGGRSLFFAEAATGSAGASLNAFAGGAVLRLSQTTGVAVAISWQEMSNLIDDPTLADNGLRVGDWRGTLVVARRLPLNLTGGVSTSYTYSAVLATRAQTAEAGASVAWDPSPRIRLVAIATGLGNGTVYADYGGERHRVTRPTQWRTALGVVTVANKTLTNHVYVDWGAEQGGTSSWAVSSDLTILGMVTGRIGASWRQSAGDVNSLDASSGAGLLIRIAALTLEYAYSPGYGDLDLVPRHHFGVVLSR